MNQILKEIKTKIKNKNLIINNELDVYYITRINSSNLSLVLINGKWYAFTDSRYFNQVKNKLDIEVINTSKDKWFSDFLKKEKFNEINISGRNTTISKFHRLKKNFDSKNIKLIAINIPYLRDLYFEEDISLLKESSKINDEIFLKAKKKMKIGMTEKDVEKIILKEILDSKAERESFRPIIASGINGSNPHWEPSDKKIKKNEMITIDMGVFYKGFASDMTRTFVLKGKVSKEEEKIFDIVKNAMDESIKIIKEGTKISDLCAKARKIISDGGYEEYFTHSLGHGLGVEIHDYPNIYINSEEKLKYGMVITIEPGIYIPNKYGVRLEQAVLVKKDGFSILNKTKVELF